MLLYMNEEQLRNSQQYRMNASVSLGSEHILSNVVTSNDLLEADSFNDQLQSTHSFIEEQSAHSDDHRRESKAHSYHSASTNGDAIPSVMSAMLPRTTGPVLGTEVEPNAWNRFMAHANLLVEDTKDFHK